MSRVGRMPITVPSDVSVNLMGDSVLIKGKLGELRQDIPEGITVEMEDAALTVTRANDSRNQRALHGLTRALIANMVHGVNKGFNKDLEIVGVGYRCEQRGKAIQLAVGYSHRVLFHPPEGVEIKVYSNTKFSVSGFDKHLVGEIAAKLRSIRPPEPYKGKGIKYVGEYIRHKAGKSAGR